MMRFLQLCDCWGRPETSVLAVSSLRLAPLAMQLTHPTSSPTETSCAGCLARKLPAALPAYLGNVAHLGQQAMQGFLASLLMITG